MNRLERKYKPRIRREKPKLLVVVNGETEEHYFRQFPIPGQLLTVECHGKIGSKKLVDKAIELRESLTKKQKYYKESGDQTWIVIDREGDDGNNRQNFIDALEAAQANDIMVAHSNRAFELWYLLHLKYEDGEQLSVEELIRRLNKALKKPSLDTNTKSLDPKYTNISKNFNTKL